MFTYVKKKKDYFLFVGNRNGYKNFSFLVDGLSKFKKFRDNFDLYLFGGSNFSNYEISKFKEKTGCPVIVNTSFNVRGEPIVNTPTDAFNCFMGTEIDYLVIGNCILDKTKQDPNLKKDYTKKFELD